jgi:hypothetical protein
MFRRSGDTLFSAVGEDIVALNIPTGLCYGMEDATAVVWKLLEEPADLDRICLGIMDLYDVDADRCRSDIQTLLDRLRAEGLVELSYEK